MTAPARPLPELGAAVEWLGRVATVIGYKARRDGTVRYQRRGTINYLVLAIEDVADEYVVAPSAVTLETHLKGGRIRAVDLRPGDAIAFGDRVIPVLSVVRDEHGTLVRISDTERVDFPLSAAVTIAPRSAA